MSEAPHYFKTSLSAVQANWPGWRICKDSNIPASGGPEGYIRLDPDRKTIFVHPDIWHRWQANVVWFE